MTAILKVLKILNKYINIQKHTQASKQQIHSVLDAIKTKRKKENRN